MSHYLAAQITAMLTVFANKERGEHGQTTAEYVGIMVVIVAIIGTILALKTNVLTGAQGVVNEVFSTLTDKIE